MRHNRYNFTKNFLDSLKPAATGKRDYYKDTRVAGLEIMVTETGNKSFKVTKKKNGSLIRVTLGQYPDLSIGNARKRALEVSAKIADGQNPNDEKHNLRQEIIFGELFREFIRKHSRQNKITWRHDERDISKFCAHWFTRKISSITMQDIKNLHDKIGSENGKYQANRLLAKISTMYSKAIEWGWQGANPARGIRKYKEHSRDRFIQPDELPRFFDALNKEANSNIRDYVYMSLYTGARKGNVMAMSWEHINLTTKEWRIPKTKNGEALILPLSDAAMAILEQRKKDKADVNNIWVFPSATSKSGHLEEPKKAWGKILQAAQISDLRIHDIRRTLGSYQAISGSSLPIIGKSLGHKSNQSTQVYSRVNLDPVRASVEKALSLIKSYESYSDV